MPDVPIGGKDGRSGPVVATGKDVVSKDQSSAIIPDPAWQCLTIISLSGDAPGLGFGAPEGPAVEDLDIVAIGRSASNAAPIGVFRMVARKIPGRARSPGDQTTNAVGWWDESKKVCEI